ncbi:MAG: hypothetical protein RLO12_23305, partial [Fulvivirga sp.]
YCPLIVLCHQANFSKIEYVKIAPKLFEMGFNVIAIDQRSGGHVMDFENETVAKAAKERITFENPVFGFLEAEKDLMAAVNFAFEEYKKPVILWGSSYSSTLALYIATNNDKVSSVVAFSPGHYLDEHKGSLKKKLEGFKKPYFVTSSKKEATGEGGVDDLIELTEKNDLQFHFIPEGEGRHGSSALWVTSADQAEYWAAITEFLKEL